MRKLLVAALLAFALAASAAPPPWDLTVTVTPSAACADGSTDLSLCPVSGYDLFINGTREGAVTAGTNVYPARIAAAGTYTFRVDTLGPGGNTAGDVYTHTISTLKPGGKVSITVGTNCDPCVQTTNP